MNRWLPARLQVFHHFLSFYGLTGWVPLLGFCVLLGMVGHMIVWIIGPVETLRYAAEDGVIPPTFQKVNRANVPRNLLLLQGIIVTLLCLLFAFVDMNTVFYIVTVLSAQLYLVMYVLMFVSAIVLRYTRPNVERPFKIPGGMPGIWLVAGTGALVGTSGIFILFTPPDDANMPMDPAWFVALTITFFIVALLVPFVVYAIRKPEWKSKESVDESQAPPMDS